MKWKTLLTAAVLLTAVIITPAHAQDYNFTAPSAGDFGTPTSDDTIYEWTDPNVDRSKNSALIPPGFGTPSSYLPNFGEFLTPNLAAGGPLNGGNRWCMMHLWDSCMFHGCVFLYLWNSSSQAGANKSNHHCCPLRQDRRIIL